MTDKEKLDTIRAEIERRIAKRRSEIEKYRGSLIDKEKLQEDLELLSFINSLEEPKHKFKAGDIIEPIDNCLGSPRAIVDVCDSWYVTDQGTLDFEYEDNWEAVEEPVSEQPLSNVERTVKNWKEKSASEDLEEAALLHLSKHYDTSVIWDEDEKCVVRDFKAGAEWQKQQDQSTIELAEDHAMLAGMEKMKEQMMKDAVDMVVGYWMPNGLMLATDESENCYNIDDGDKVKVIVIKENQL